VKHWHGAAPDSWLVHLSVETNANAGPAKWLEPVTDEEYNNLK
jgi:quercetin dioxygenase-like cupin family protein